MINKILSFVFVLYVLTSCNKDENLGGMPNNDNYSSVEDFFQQNSVKTDTYLLRTDTVEMFRTIHGTDIRIEPNSFQDHNGDPVTGMVKVEFKELYTVGEMLFSRMPTVYYTGNPLRSAGMFYIEVTSNDIPVFMAPNKSISVSQMVPFGETIDTNMIAFNRFDSMPGIPGWVPSYYDTLQYTMNEYIYKLYEFSTPADSGTWSNSDDINFFSAYTMTHLSIHSDDSVNVYGTNVFLIFKNIRSMVHVYNYSMVDFNYNSAPEGFECTIVAVGVKDSKLVACFKPYTIQHNGTVSISLQEMTTADFKSRLGELQ